MCVVRIYKLLLLFIFEPIFTVWYRAHHTIANGSSTYNSCSLHHDILFMYVFYINICSIYIFLRILNVFTMYICYSDIRYNHNRTNLSQYILLCFLSSPPHYFHIITISPYHSNTYQEHILKKVNSNLEQVIPPSTANYNNLSCRHCILLVLS